jgi:hypothetical protein
VEGDEVGEAHQAVVVLGERHGRDRGAHGRAGEDAASGGVAVLAPLVVVLLLLLVLEGLSAPPLPRTHSVMLP